MDKLIKSLPYIIGALVIMGLSTLLPTEQPFISVPAEHIFYLGPINVTNSLLTSWVCIIIILAIAGIGLSSMKMQPTGLQNVLEWMYELIYNLTENVAGPKHVKQFFAIPATIFFYVLVSNWFALFPGFPLLGVGVCEELHYEDEAKTMEVVEAEEGHGEAADDHGEDKAHGWWNTCPAGTHLVPLFRSPSADLNNTLSLAVITQVLAQIFGFAALGVGGYLGKFFVIHKMTSASSVGEFALGAIDFMVGLLEFLSEFVKVVAYTFRLYGNIFAGEVTVMILTFFVPLILALPMLAFEIFVGFIQAFVFYILSVAFYTLAVSSHGDEAH